MSDQQSAVPEDSGQTAEAQGNQLEAAADEAMAQEAGQPEMTPQEQAEAFLETEIGGKKISLKDRDEALEYIRNGTLMQSDYTRKTQALAEERKKFEAERDQLMEQIKAEKAKYDQYRTFLNQNPHIYEQLEKLKNQPLGPQHQAQLAQKQVEERLSPVQKELEELRQWKQQQESERQREQLMSELEKELDGFDRKEVERIMQEFSPKDPRSVLTLLHYAAKGRTPPSQPNNEVLQAKRLQEKQAARTVPSPGSVRSEAGAFSSLEEAEAAALANES